MTKSPLYIERGLETTEAMVLASFIGWRMAVAKYADKIGVETAQKIAGLAGDNIKALMLDETLELGESKHPIALVGTKTGEFLADLLAVSLEDTAIAIRAKFETEETENAAV